jgi:hypothetical protein
VGPFAASGKFIGDPVIEATLGVQEANKVSISHSSSPAVVRSMIASARTTWCLVIPLHPGVLLQMRIALLNPRQWRREKVFGIVTKFDFLSTFAFTSG